ncbi:Sin component scaffold protein cdc11 [Mycena sanguinolenta]|uniref:Sin component scaffold protein cdc11 n=1 Tax=Mycena sanguinolenta TaxID=230812 RepID=A0A8H6YFM3_9AGAR|nr:Sin component scaffold protein cdc11 [Mycena sanguinolenta]
MNSNSTGPYSSSTYRQQAAALMAQIKSDMKGNKRIFSGDSEMSHVTAHLEDEVSFAHLVPSINIHSHDKENQRENSRHHRRVSSTSSARTRASPRRPPRSLEPTVAEGDLAGDMSKLSLGWRRPSSLAPQGNINIIANPALLGPAATPAFPTGTMRSGTNEDLNRFVSSSTASGTTLTAGSVPSYVKHQGPAQLRTIAPKDLPTLPDRMGDMMFDKVMMKWVKSVQTDGVIPEEPSEDPFGDIESLRDDTRAEERDGPEDEEEMELTSFSTDASGRVVAVMTGVDTNELVDTTTDSEGENDAVVTGELEHTVPTRRESETESEDEDIGDRTEVPHQHVVDSESLTDAFAPPPIVVTAFTTPPPSATKTPASTAKTTRSSTVTPKPKSAPTPTSALKSAAATPSSALKDPNRSRYRTPRRTHRRSVSFSDGKRDGPIRGLNSATVEPSARSKRIAEMLARSDSELDSDSPIKGSGARASGSGSSLVSATPASSNASGSTSRSRTFSRSHASRSVGHKNGTFLTECSFGVAHDRLVETASSRAARLKEFLPALDELNLNANHLSWLSGIPGGVRTLSVASNRLTGLTSYSHLLNLENLDISRNEVDSLRQLAPLRHLRELRADGNTIASAEGLERMDGLVKLSLEGNALTGLDLSGFRWTRLEMLNVRGNRIERVAGLAGLQALVAFNVDDNRLSSLDAGGAMPRLRILRASGNRLRTLHVHWFAGLRTLYVDSNALDGENALGGALGRLENLSLRNQLLAGGRVLKLGFEDIMLTWLPGNALPANFLSAACYNLVYLELANCRLATLPAGLATLTPNLRALNLNYNFLEDVRGLEGLARLRKLSVVGARLKGTKEIIRVVRGLPEVEVLDFRMNPCTLGWYLPLIMQGEELSATRWAELDGRFRRGLPDAVYVGRLAYRGLVMDACSGVRVLDGIGVTEKERAKSVGVLRQLSGDQLNSYNVAQLHGADKDISFLVPDIDYDTRRMSSSAASADTESSSLSRGEKRAITPNDSPQPKKIRPLDQNTNWEVDSSESGNLEDKDQLDASKVSLPSIFTTFEDSYRPERRQSLPNLSERSSVRHAPYPPSHLRQNYAPSSLSTYQFPPTNEEDRSGRPSLSDLRFDNNYEGSPYPPQSAVSNEYARTPHLSPYGESDHWTTSPSGIVRPSSTPGQLSSPAMFAGSARISGHHAADRRSLSAGIKGEWAFPASDFPLPSGAAGVQQYPMPPAPALNSPNRSPQSAPNSSLVERPHRKRGKLPKETTDFLKAWLHRHSDHPYPSEEEKKQLCHATGLSMSQVSNWMINVSRRASISSFISLFFVHHCLPSSFSRPRRHHHQSV